MIFPMHLMCLLKVCRNYTKAASFNGKAFDPWVESSLGGLCFESRRAWRPFRIFFWFLSRNSQRGRFVRTQISNWVLCSFWLNSGQKHLSHRIEFKFIHSSLWCVCWRRSSQDIKDSSNAVWVVPRFYVINMVPLLLRYECILIYIYIYIYRSLE